MIGGTQLRKHQYLCGIGGCEIDLFVNRYSLKTGRFYERRKIKIMTINREDIGVSYIRYDVNCPNCDEKIYMYAEEAKQNKIKCDNCGESHEAEGKFEAETSTYSY